MLPLLLWTAALILLSLVISWYVRRAEQEPDTELEQRINRDLRLARFYRGKEPPYPEDL